MQGALTLITAVLLAGTPVTARAQPAQEVALWKVDRGKLPAGETSALREALERALREVPEINLVRPAGPTVKAVKRVERRCKKLSPRCAAKAGVALGVSHVVIAAVRGRKSLKLRLQLIDVDRLSVLSTATGILRVRSMAADVTRVVDELALVFRPPVGAIVVRSNVSGAQVRVDGRVVGRTPLPGPIQDLVVGTHELHVSAPEHEPYAGSVDVRSGIKVRIMAELKAQSVPPKAEQESQEADSGDSKTEPATEVTSTEPAGSPAEVHEIVAHEAASGSTEARGGAGLDIKTQAQGIPDKPGHRMLQVAVALSLGAANGELSGSYFVTRVGLDVALAPFADLGLIARTGFDAELFTQDYYVVDASQAVRGIRPDERRLGFALAAGYDVLHGQDLPARAEAGLGLSLDSFGNIAVQNDLRGLLVYGRGGYEINDALSVKAGLSYVPNLFGTTQSLSLGGSPKWMIGWNAGAAYHIDSTFTVSASYEGEQIAMQTGYRRYHRGVVGVVVDLPL